MTDKKVKKGKKYKHSENTNMLHGRLVALDEARELVAKPFGFLWARRVDAKAILAVAEKYADAKSEFWIAFIKEHPETYGKNMSANAYYVTIN